VELLVAVLIAGIFFAAAAPVFVNALRVTRDDTAKVTAQNIAQQKMEQIRRLQFNELPKLTDGSVDLSTWMGGAFTTTVEGYVGTAAKTYTVAYTVAF
jgi:type II secretory pathway pseudopilin PulG